MTSGFKKRTVRVIHYTVNYQGHDIYITTFDINNFILINIQLFPTKKWQHSEECMRRLRNIALESVTLESVTNGSTDRWTDGRMTDKVIPMCRYASQATQKYCKLQANFENCAL